MMRHVKITGPFGSGVIELPYIPGADLEKIMCPRYLHTFWCWQNITEWEIMPPGYAGPILEDDDAHALLETDIRIIDGSGRVHHTYGGDSPPELVMAFMEACNALEYHGYVAGDLVRYDGRTDPED